MRGRATASSDVADGDAARRRGEVAREVLALDTEADDRHLLALPVLLICHSTLAHSTSASAMPANPPSMPTSQKRVTTCVSAQPPSWKW